MSGIFHGGLRAGKPRRLAGGFTLLEVMIAAGIFFMAIFAILELISSNLRHAKIIQQSHVDAGMVLADVVQTNKLTEGTQNGDFKGLYPGYTWTYTVTQELTNGFFRVDCTITRPGGGADAASTTSVFLYRPDSVAGAKF